jgi:hypothetical protein
MHLNPIFSVCVGVDDLSEHLASAREVFIENKKMFKPSVLDSGVRTTLETMYTLRRITTKKAKN